MGRRNLDDRKVVKEGIKKKEERGKKKIQAEGQNNHKPNLCRKTS